MGPQSLGGSCEGVKAFLHTLRNPLMEKDGKGLQSLRGEHSSRLLSKAKGKEFCTEIIADQHFSLEMLVCSPLRQVKAGYLRLDFGGQTPGRGLELTAMKKI